MKKYQSKLRTNWNQIKEEWEAGVPTRELAMKYSCTTQAINRRAKVEGWVKQEQPSVSKQLTEKEKKFCEEYALNFNGSQSVVKAGYKVLNPRQHAYSLLTKPYIREEIDELIDERRKIYLLDEYRILEEDMYVAFADPREVFDENGNVLPPNQLPEWVARALSSIEVDERYDKDGNKTVKHKYRFWNKGNAIERLDKKFNFYNEYAEQYVLNIMNSMTKILDSIDREKAREFIRRFDAKMRGEKEDD